MEKDTSATSETQGYSEVDLGQICNRAYQLFEERGRVHGYDFDDWVRAEAEIRFRNP